jgi:hypothetical protein
MNLADECFPRAGANTSKKNYFIRGIYHMKKRLLKVAITTALTVAFAAPAFAAANPFTDVPAKHWAYDAVAKLAQAGIVDGYSDKTFRGDKTITRYEMAQIVAKAMGKSTSQDQRAVVQKLANEFSNELNTLGVKVEGMQNQLDNMVKVSGDARVRYENVGGYNDATDFRARVNFDGKVNDGIKFNARITSQDINSLNAPIDARLDTANVTFDALGLTNTIGRQDIYLGDGFLMDTQMNAVSTQIGGFKAFGGSVNSGTMNRIYGAEYSTDIHGVTLTGDYLKDVTRDKQIYAANTSFGLFDGAVTVSGEYAKNSTDNAKAYGYGLKLNNYGLSAMYRNVEAAAFLPTSTLAGENAAGTIDTIGNNGFKGMEYRYDRTLMKNTDLTVRYQDFKDQAGAKLTKRAMATVNVKF